MTEPVKRDRTEAWIDYMDLFDDSRDWPIDHIHAEGYEVVR